MNRLLPYILPIGIVLMAFLSVGCSRTDPEEARVAAAVENKGVVKAVAEPYPLRQTLYHNGDIITMAGPEDEFADGTGTARGPYCLRRQQGGGHGALRRQG